MNNAYKLTDEHRFSVCIHEAAHAVIYALGGLFIYRLAIAPEGCTEWTCEGRKGGMLTDLWGVCCPSDSSACFWMKWDDENWCYRSDRKGYEELFRNQVKNILPLIHREIRAHVCGNLAGPIADDIYHGEDEGIYLEPENDPTVDSAKAYGLSLFLPWRNEYDSLTAVTEKTLRRPDVWAMVLRLAGELQRRGDMEDFAGFLPEAVEGWPSSPRCEHPVEIGEIRLQAA